MRIAAAAVGVFATLFVSWGLIGWGNPAVNEQAIGEVSRWCERVSGGLLREPVNTLGNLGFVVAGLAMFATLARDTVRDRPRVNRFIGNSPTALLYASAAVFLGPGSMVMHGSHTFFGAWIDNVSMVAYILIPWLVNLAGLGGWTDRTLFTAYGSILALYAAGYWFVGPELGIGLDLFAVSIGLWIISEFLYRFWSPALRPLSGLVGFVVALAFGITPWEMAADPGEYWWVVLFWLPALLARRPAPQRRRYVPWFWVGIGSFMTAYAIWLTGTADHAWCSPDSLLQAHALWHLLSALATWAFFLFLRSGRPLTVDTGPAGPVVSDTRVGGEPAGGAELL
jgi:hypothetical protein